MRERNVDSVHIDHKDAEWEAASCMANLANFLEHFEQNGVEAIQKHNEQVENCNHVIKAAEPRRPITSPSSSRSG